MRFTANRSELLPILRRCSLTIGRRFESRELSCVLMEADAKTNTVMFTARSKGCVLQIRHGCRVEQEGKALLFAAVFQRMLELFSDEATTVATDDRRIEVRNAKSAYEFALMDVGKYPKADQPAPEQLLDCENFSEISTKVLFSAARGESTRPQLKCVRLQVHDGRFSASSCDGYRMTVASDTAAQDAPLDVLIEADQMKTLLAVFRGIPHCKIGTGDGKVLFIGPGLVFTATLASYGALNLDTLLTSFRADSALHLDGAAFNAELRRIGVGHSAGASVILQTAGGVLRLSYSSADREPLTSESEVPVEIDTPLPKQGFCYNYSYLREAAALVQGSAAQICFDSKGTMQLCTEHETHILMPKRMLQVNATTKKKKKAA